MEIWRFLTLIFLLLFLLFLCLFFIRTLSQWNPSGFCTTAKVIPLSPTWSRCGRVNTVCLCLEDAQCGQVCRLGSVTPKTNHGHGASMKALQPSLCLLMSLVKDTHLWLWPNSDNKKGKTNKVIRKVLMGKLALSLHGLCACALGSHWGLVVLGKNAAYSGPSKLPFLTIDYITQ